MKELFTTRQVVWVFTGVVVRLDAVLGSAGGAGVICGIRFWFPDENVAFDNSFLLREGVDGNRAGQSGGSS